MIFISENRQSRKYQLTINNPIDKGLEHDAIKAKLSEMKSLDYWCMANEIGHEGTPHIHIYIAAKSPIRFSTLKTRFPEAHIEQAIGTSAQNRDYVLKEGGKYNKNPDGTYAYTDTAGKQHSGTNFTATFEEWGELPQEPGQGRRSDIALLYEMIKGGMTNAEIMAANPNLAGHISLMDKIRLDILEAQYKDEWRKLTVTYIWGPTGTGKTRGVMEKHGYSNVYRVTDYKHPFDRYASQSVLCLDEFRSSLMIGDMLDYLDGYPLALQARYANRQACFTEVYIISNIDIFEQYPNIQASEPATWEALLRRIHKVVKYFHDGHSVEYTTEQYLNSCVEVDYIDDLPFDS